MKISMTVLSVAGVMAPAAVGGSILGWGGRGGADGATVIASRQADTGRFFQLCPNQDLRANPDKVVVLPYFNNELTMKNSTCQVDTLPDLPVDSNGCYGQKQSRCKLVDEIPLENPLTQTPLHTVNPQGASSAGCSTNLDCTVYKSLSDCYDDKNGAKIATTTQLGDPKQGNMTFTPGWDDLVKVYRCKLRAS